MTKSYNNRKIFAEKICEDFIDSITGRNVEQLKGINPDKAYYVGKLFPVIETLNGNEMTSNVIVSQMSIDFFLKEEHIHKARVAIKIKGDFYYRVLPTYEEQLNYYIDTVSDKISDMDLNTITEINDFFRMNSKNLQITNLNKCDIYKVYNKISFDDTYFEIELDEVVAGKAESRFSFNNKIIEYLDVKIDEIMANPKVYRPINDNISSHNLISEIEYEEFLDMFRNKDIPRPNFNIDLLINTKLVGEGKYRISASLINKTESNIVSRNLDKAPYLPILFNSGVEICLQNAEYRDIELDYFLDDYKYNKTTKGIGTNCSIEFDAESNKLVSTNIPMFIQKRLKTREDLSVKFMELIEDPVTVLNKVAKRMEKELDQWVIDYETKKDHLVSDREHLESAQRTYTEEIKSFEFEIKRFKYGIEQIKNREMVRKSFINMNKAFKNTSDKYDSWRLFQLVFIVSVIPDIISTHYGEDDIDKSFIDMVDLLYFPTGGGKTEAFIGCIIFTLFFDRIRGKKSGVSGLIKYPLRLLSVQQIDRLANVLASAEIIREQEAKIFDGDRFSLGYFVGDSNTPNKLTETSLQNYLSKSQEQLNDELRIIDYCPFCKQKSINIAVNEESLRIIHTCNTEGCPSKGEVPLIIVDNEIYRYLPSVIISTIDKIASIGFQSNFRNILGDVFHKCPKHGYTSKKTCTEKDLCKVDVTEFIDVELFDPSPSLIIQDEVHLIRESLGTFNSHYETLIQYMLENLCRSNKKVKVIGATATISNYEKQILDLYNKRPVRFPSKSPFIGKDFYSYTDDNDINRIILSYAPFGRSIMDSVVYSLKYLRKIVQKYYSDIDLVKKISGIYVDSDEEAFEIVKDYWIFLEYNNVRIDGNRVINAIENIINPQLSDENFKEFDIRKMTGDENFQDVRKILSEIENNDEVFDGVNLIAATSMISHGVDAERFNMMMFFGMPNNTAEYIQAYSRVGRKYPGIVIDIIRPTRAKDMSYLKFFVKFHEFKDILIEPVPINRWASKAIESTLTGIVSAILINNYDLKYQYEYGNIYDMKVFKKLVEAELINIEELTNHVLKAYACELEDGGNSNPSYYYKEFIISSINRIYESVRDKTFSDEYYYLPSKGISLLDNRLSPAMTSLRYTENSVNIELR
ncbi:helicase-related protein [Gudongella oleilytica]|uniref:helicase-related protein n=1 Tax=Gudongella oleilytica TaxID=1582259 RepID=UPI000FF8B1EA|nr:helicase-related protein [Gudongella oleilytica]